MDTTSSYQFREGDNVVGSDGEKLGKIHSVGQGYLVVEKGFFFPTDYYIPYNAVSSYDEGDGTVYLSVSKDEAMNSGWDMEPGTGGDYTAESYVGSANTNLTDSEFGSDAITGTASTAMTGASAGMGTPVYTETETDLGVTGAQSGQYIDNDHTTVQVREEELVARTREREAGEVIVHKDVVAEEKTIEVPVTEERVRVTRRTVDRLDDTGEVSLQEETFEVPVRTTEVDLEKRTRVAEEIDIDKEAVQRTEQVSGTVRREVVNVEDDTTTGGQSDL
jgi:uncharacterized protein (TIGR02271 family)